MDIMSSLKLESPGGVLRGVARRARDKRLEVNLTQVGLAERSGVSLGTLKLFERSGVISLASLIKIAFALDSETGFAGLFPAREPITIEDVIEKPKRARRRRT